MIGLSASSPAAAKTERERFTAAHAAILAGRELRVYRADVRHGGRQLGGLAIGVARAQRRQVRVANRRVLRELLVQPFLDRGDVAAEHPLHEAERPEILAAPRVALAQAELRGRFERVLRDVDLDDLIAVEHAALARILLVAGLREPAAREAVDVENDQRAVGDQRQVDLQRRRIERDEHLRRVAGRRDGPRAEMNLIGGHAERRAGRRADLGRVIGERREVVARERGGRHELGADQLHAVARVAGESMTTDCESMLLSSLVDLAAAAARCSCSLSRLFRLRASRRGTRYARRRRILRRDLLAARCAQGAI